MMEVSKNPAVTRLICFYSTGIAETAISKATMDDNRTVRDEVVVQDGSGPSQPRPVYLNHFL